MASADLAAAASVWTRTSEKSAPNRFAMSARTRGLSGCPPPLPITASPGKAVCATPPAFGGTRDGGSRVAADTRWTAVPSVGGGGLARRDARTPSLQVAKHPMEPSRLRTVPAASQGARYRTVTAGQWCDRGPGRRVAVHQDLGAFARTSLGCFSTVTHSRCAGQFPRTHVRCRIYPPRLRKPAALRKLATSLANRFDTTRLTGHNCGHEHRAAADCP